MATEVSVKRIGGFENEIEIGRHRLIADEPEAAGGGDRGPDPYGFLLAALGSCISMTVSLYAERKGWRLEGVEVKLRHQKVHLKDCADCGEGKPRMLDRIEKTLVFGGPLDEDQKRRLTEIAERCPVHRTLTGEVQIRSVER